MQKLNFVNANRPTTFSSTVRCDVRTIATLLTFWQKQGESPRSVAELMRLSLETFRDVVTYKDPAVEVLTNDLAVELLRESGLADPLATHRRNRATLASQLQLEDSVLDGFDATKVVANTGKPHKVSSQQVEAAKQRMRELECGETLEAATNRRNRELKMACEQLFEAPPEATQDE